MSEMKKVRKGTEIVCELRPGDKYCYFRGMVIIANPEHPPRIVHPDGKVEDLIWFDGERPKVDLKDTF